MPGGEDAEFRLSSGVGISRGVGNLDGTVREVKFEIPGSVTMERVRVRAVWSLRGLRTWQKR